MLPLLLLLMWVFILVWVSIKPKFRSCLSHIKRTLTLREITWIMSPMTSRGQRSSNWSILDGEDDGNATTNYWEYKVRNSLLVLWCWGDIKETSISMASLTSWEWMPFLWWSFPLLHSFTPSLLHSFTHVNVLPVTNSRDRCFHAKRDT